MKRTRKMAFCRTEERGSQRGEERGKEQVLIRREHESMNE
jgi:hypothetical protein